MTARTWFTIDNTADLTAVDIAVLNRAARNFWPVEGKQPTRLGLMTLRQKYRPGLSARELCDILDQEEMR